MYNIQSNLIYMTRISYQTLKKNNSGNIQRNQMYITLYCIELALQSYLWKYYI